MNSTPDAGTVALLEQFDVETRDAEKLIPLVRNRRLRRHEMIGGWIDKALRSYDSDGEFGPVPVVRIIDCEVETFRRNGAKPIADDRAQTRCLKCSEAHLGTVPFWINCGHVIFQADLCPTCSDNAVLELDALPQTWV
ncbi:RING finger protein [Demequina zhanjiangensis]|uniref:Zinc finger, RING-type domain-containing protein n=1 Tax=Demequina zhanjiangensis TaxID=3051659 RepID=A0ABT8G396_9MICO|nr:zinc finger, RING-type domain-containing protein [Demequina sp. SYSU T00b26]MDN4473568.1 zinc finger, RING-type domain-containing protein [Demequina sp. SYSU T00b26]